jgi:hypothetical protein
MNGIEFDKGFTMTVVNVLALPLFISIQSLVSLSLFFVKNASYSVPNDSSSNTRDTTRE